MLEPHRKVAKMLYEHGHAVPVTSAVMKNRVLLGLYEVPPTVHGSDEQLDEIRTLLKLTGFDQLLEDKVPEIRISESLTYVQQPVPKRSIAEEKA
jgi:heterodisulfide reductase subunit C